MQHLSANEFRSDLNHILDRVNDDHEPVVVNRGEGRAVVVLDAADYDGIMETLHLLRSPTNADRLRRGIEQHRRGEAKEIDVAAYLD